MKKLLLTFTIVLMAISVSAQSLFVSSLKAKAKKGTTVYGTVECEGKPMEGVAVSDGYTITTTDKKGVYQLATTKHDGHVFITIPSGYEAFTEGADPVPQYWANLTEAPEIAERHDFALRIAPDQSHHIMLAITDIHLANMFNDVEQFNNKVMPRINSEVEQYRKQGVPVYTMCMGDSSFDMYWYDYLYEISDFRKTLISCHYPTPIFHVTGNHDHDGATPVSEDTDFDAAKKYRETFGPSWYSFNIGGIHYIMLDDIIYLNEKEGGLFKKAKNVVGRRNYECAIRADELEWLKQDLALITDKTTPIVIGMHCPLLKYNHLTKDKSIGTYFRPRKEAMAELTEVLKDFTTVNFVTGHTHKNQPVIGKDDPTIPNISNIIDHNIEAIAGSWWVTGALGGLTLGPDGGPAGYKVFDMSDKNVQWHFTSIDDGAEKQFRTFDMNSVREYVRNSGEVRAYMDHYKGAPDYTNIADNCVFIHVWSWQTDWKISVKENGKEIPVKFAQKGNPQYLISYHVPKRGWKNDYGDKGVVKHKRNDGLSYMFVAHTSAPDSTLDITVTDSFGNVYTEHMVRPKPFGKLMR